MRYYLGIDPGASGGLAAISQAEQVYQLPLKELEPVHILEWLHLFNLGSVVGMMELVTGYIPGREDMKHGGQPGSHMFTFGKSVGILVGLLTASAIPYEEIGPKSWQKALGIRGRDAKGGETKPQFKSRLKEEAQRLYPKVPITLQTCDALMLAHYCKIQHSQ